MPRSASISRSVLSEQVKDRLLQAIMAGRYPPGSRIVETRAAREFGTSQAPVREALRDLEALGVVEIAAFRGARVRRPSVAELLEAFAVRSELEKLAVRLALPRLTEADIDELEGYLAEMHRDAAEDDVHAEAAADTSFHRRIVEVAGNSTLGRLWRLLEPFSRTYITIVAPGADRGAIADLHEPVIDALRRRDPDLAIGAIDHHFTEARSMLAGLWAEPEPSATAHRPIRARRAPALRAPADARPSERTT